MRTQLGSQAARSARQPVAAQLFHGAGAAAQGLGGLLEGLWGSHVQRRGPYRGLSGNPLEASKGRQGGREGGEEPFDAIKKRLMASRLARQNGFFFETLEGKPSPILSRNLAFNVPSRLKTYTTFTKMLMAYILIHASSPAENFFLS